VKILFLTKYTAKGPSSRYRTFQYLPYFTNHGIECTVSPLFSDAYLASFWGNKRTDYAGVISQYLKRLLQLFRAGRFDYVFIEYEVFAYLPATFERLLKMFGVKYILDYDDAIFHNYDLHNRGFVRKLLKNKIPVAMRYAFAVITGSPYLTSFARMYNNNVVEIPTSVDMDNYTPNFIPVPTDKFTIGWIGSKSTSKYVMDILPAIESFAADYPCRLSLVGFDADLLKKREDYIKVLPWDGARENEYLNSFTVGIMPLRDTPWERGKCGFKMIQYMACGKPVIVSPLPANIKIDRNKTALFASKSEDWYDCFREVYENRARYAEIGTQNRKVVEEYYSIQANSKKYLEVLL